MWVKIGWMILVCMEIVSCGGSFNIRGLCEVVWDLCVRVHRCYFGVWCIGNLAI